MKNPHFLVGLFLLLTFYVAALLNTGWANAQVVDTTAASQLVAAADTSITPITKPPAFKKADSIQLRKPKVHRPSGAALRSAILPGWGQVYNGKLWKVPIVYAALGVTGTILVDNLVWYKRTRYAYTIAHNITQGEDSIGSASYAKIDDNLKRVFFEGTQGVLPESLKSRRDYYRRNLNYAIIYFAIGWALNVVEATVDAHLSSFDVSPDLSFKIEPGYSQMAGTAGVSLVLRQK